MSKMQITAIVTERWSWYGQNLWSGEKNWRTEVEYTYVDSNGLQVMRHDLEKPEPLAGTSSGFGWAQSDCQMVEGDGSMYSDIMGALYPDGWEISGVENRLLSETEKSYPPNEVLQIA